MATNTIDLSYIAKDLLNDIKSVIQNELLIEVEKAFREAAEKAIYSGGNVGGSSWYINSFAMMDALEIKDIKVTNRKAVFTININPDKMQMIDTDRDLLRTNICNIGIDISDNNRNADFTIYHNPEKMQIIDYGRDMLSTYMGTKVQDAREIVLHSLNTGSSGSPIYNHKGTGYFDIGYESVEETAIRTLISSLSSRGWTIT